MNLFRQYFINNFERLYAKLQQVALCYIQFFVVLKNHIRKLDFDVFKFTFRQKGSRQSSREKMFIQILFNFYSAKPG